ncbi:hypothetical protein ASG60_20650 [Methylobacterium sp. Leaf469]|nr:hypothetical protein ASG60_20650 [Methylobacterium sp. Leaf469]
MTLRGRWSGGGTAGCRGFPRVVGQGFAWLEVGVALDWKPKAIADGCQFCQQHIAEFRRAMAQFTEAERSVRLVWVKFAHKLSAGTVGHEQLQHRRRV